MASILMHIGLALELVDHGYIEAAQRERFVLGTLLPDYTIAQNHHFRAERQGRKCFSLCAFRQRYGELVAKDVMYTGYYLHLLEDNIFRDLLYNKYAWKSVLQGNRQKLYDDYSALNSYFVSRYSLTPKLISDALALDRDIGFKINYEELTAETHMYFSTPPKADHTPFLFSREIADEFLEKAYRLCTKELSCVKNGEGYIDENQFSWV